MSGPAVVFRPPGRPEARVAVEVARTQRQTQRGLMYREHLPPDAGMLFLFAAAKVQSLLDEEHAHPARHDLRVVGAMVVVGVVENAEPSTADSRTVPGVASQYVVEVNGGWARAHGVGPASRSSFDDVAPLGPATAARSTRRCRRHSAPGAPLGVAAAAEHAAPAQRGSLALEPHARLHVRLDAGVPLAVRDEPDLGLDLERQRREHLRDLLATGSRLERNSRTSRAMIAKSSSLVDDAVLTR